MEVELLHIHHGDKKKHIDTTRPEGRNEVDKLLKNLCAQKCAVFLERGKKSYRVVGYDKASDQLIVENPARHQKKKTLLMKATKKASCKVSAAEAKVAAVAPVAGGLLTMEQRVRAAKIKLGLIAAIGLGLLLAYWAR
jgi:hypothetical protein